MDFAEVTGAAKERVSWMEKFGEWKEIDRVHAWEKDGAARWEVLVFAPGDYEVSLTYAGTGRIVWGVDVEGGEHIQNQQNASHNYQRFPIGWVNFPEAGRYAVSVSCVDGEREPASLKSIHFTPVAWK